MFEFDKDYFLKNARVELSPLTTLHEAQLFAVSNEAEIWQHFEEQGYGRDNFARYIKRALRARGQKTEYTFVIKDLNRDQYAGMTRIYAVNNEHKNVKIGHTWIGTKFQATGLNKNCKYLLFEFLFETLQVERIGFGASAENINSIKAMESVGCKQEGRLRSFLPSADGTKRVDIVLLSILKHEWEDNAKIRLQQQLATYF
ncbi:MAG: GNAT family protein [Bacteroidota bacterium]